MIEILSSDEEEQQTTRPKKRKPKNVKKKKQRRRGRKRALEVEERDEQTMGESLDAEELRYREDFNDERGGKRRRID